jgi:hypothetical protein
MEPIMLETCKYISDNNIILYGGCAMNMYLPPKKQFYSANDIPDYDGFLPEKNKKNPKKTGVEFHSIDFVEKLIKKKYTYLMVYKALHEGTMTIKWDNNAIADFTEIHRQSYTELLKKSKKMTIFLANQSIVVRVLPLYLVKSNAYLELCMPMSSMFRWAKVYDRLIRVEKHVPNDKKTTKIKLFNKKNENVKLMNTLDKVFDMVKHLPLVGMSAICYYLGLGINTHKTINNFRYISCISTNPNELADNIVSVLRKLGYKPTKYSSEFNTFTTLKTCIDLPIDGVVHRIISIHHTQSRCLGFVNVTFHKRKYQVAPVFYVIHMLYYYMYKYDKSDSRDKVECVLINMLRKQTKEMLVEQCVGTHVSVSVIKKNKLVSGDTGRVFSFKT